MYNGKVIIGVSGTIGSGKTTVCEILGTMGAYYISADQVGWEVLPDIVQELREYFGGEIINEGKVDRDKLADLVFGNPNHLAYLNSISHPLLTARIKSRIEHAPGHMVVIDAALLFDWPDIMEIVDYPVVVTAPEVEKRSRCIARGMDPVRYQQIRTNQKDDTFLSQKARFIINNNGTVDDLHGKCQNIIKEIKHGHRV